jgi:hypothetical protein
MTNDIRSILRSRPLLTADIPNDIFDGYLMDDLKI